MSDLIKTEPIISSFLVKSQHSASDYENKMCLNFEPSEFLQGKQKMKKKNNGDDQYRAKENKYIKSRWNRTQDLAYIRFIKQNAILFDSQNLRRSGRVFLRMSQEMNGMRTPNQCKSHHQKMQKVTKGGSLDSIISHLTKKHAQQADKDTKTRETDYSESQSVDQELNQNGHRSVILNLGKIREIKVYVCVDRIEQW